MNLVKPSFQIIEQSVPEIPSYEHARGLDDIQTLEEQYKNQLLLAAYKQIELAGRTCYKSEDKITEDSAKPFVERMIASKHYAMLEHGTIYLHFYVSLSGIDKVSAVNNCVTSHKYLNNPYSRVVLSPKNNAHIYVTTNLRVIVENHWEDDLKYICAPTEFHEKRVTVRYTTNIHFYKDCTRHRMFSWAIESTRFCNYIKDKYGHSVSFIYPCWLKPEELNEFEEDLKTIEQIYFKWIEKGWQAQQAATFLPQATKAEVVMTGFIKDWKHFFDLRALGTTGTPHPQVQELVVPLYEEFKNRKYIE